MENNNIKGWINPRDNRLTLYNVKYNTFFISTTPFNEYGEFTENAKRLINLHKLDPNDFDLISINKEFFFSKLYLDNSKDIDYKKYEKYFNKVHKISSQC